MSGQANLIRVLDDYAVEKIASNSLVLEPGDLVKLDPSVGFIEKVDTGDTIEGVSLTKYTYTSNNQTVAKKKVIYRPLEANATYQLKSDATVFTDAMIGNFFDLNTNQTVDFTTASTTTGQVRLEKIMSNALYGEFSIVNL